MTMGRSKEEEAKWERFLALPIPSHGKTLGEIAKAAGCSKERIRQIEEQALRKLFKKLQHLREELLDSGEKSNI